MGNSSRTKPELIKENSSLKHKIKELEGSEARGNKDEGALHKSDDLYHTFFDLAPNPMAISSVDNGRLIDVNRAFVAWSHYSRNELIGRTTTELGFWVNNESRDATINLLRNTGFVGDVEIELKRGNGEVRQILFSGKLIEIENNKWFLSVARDITDHKNTEQALKQSEEKYRNIFEHAVEGFYQTTPEGRFLSVNPALAQMMGFASPEEMIATYVDIEKQHYVNPEDRTIFKRLLERDSAVQAFETRLYRKDGSVIWTSRSGRTVRDASGKILYYEGTVEDITSRKQAEYKLQNEKETFFSILNNAPYGILVNDPDGGLLFINPEATNITGYNIEDIPTGKVLFKKMYPDNDYRKNVIRTWIKDVSRKSIDRVFRACRKDGTVKDLELRTFRLADNKTVTMFSDITERRRAQETLQESQQRLSDIINFLPDATFAIDKEGRVIAWNRAIEEMTGVKAGDMLGKDNYEHSLPFYGTRRPILIDMVFKSVEEIKKKYHAVQKEGDILIAEADVPIKGEIRTIWGKASPLYDSKGNITGAIESIRDITEHKGLEAQFLQSQKMEAVGALAGGIAHDLNNLLTGIRMHAYLGRGTLEKTDPAYAKLKNIEDIVDSAANLTKQFLGFARGGKYEVKPTDLNDIINRTVTFFGRTKKEITIHKEYQEAPWAVDADQGQMEQALLNLFVNAQHAMPGGGNINVRTENVTLDEESTAPYLAGPGRYVKVSVTDNGTGIDEAIRDRIFDPFFTTKERGIGTGLGLASVYGIVKNHGGFITVDSEAGKGSTFNIFLPATDKEAVRGKPARAKLLTGTETILLVDDEKEILGVTAAIFEALGYRVYGAESGRKAVETYRTHSDDITAVVLDFIMPGMDGEETYDKMKEINPDVRVILSSGYSMNEAIRRTMQKGCKAFVQKPYDIRALSVKIREVLDG